MFDTGVPLRHWVHGGKRHSWLAGTCKVGWRWPRRFRDENMGKPTKIPWFIVVCHWYLNVFDQYMAMERGFVLLNHATPLRIPVQRNPWCQWHQVASSGAAVQAYLFREPPTCVGQCLFLQTQARWATLRISPGASDWSEHFRKAGRERSIFWNRVFDMSGCGSHLLFWVPLCTSRPRHILILLPAINPAQLALHASWFLQHVQTFWWHMYTV